jgi:hypothetical protein
MTQPTITTEAFIIERVALHYVDRAFGEPRLNPEEIDLAQFQTEEDQEAMADFLGGHLTNLWNAEESSRTLAGKFPEGAPLKEIYNDVKEQPDGFFEASQEVTRQLFNKAKGRSYSAGALVIVWFRPVGTKVPYLGLLKLDPGPSYKVMLSETKGEAALMELVVEHLTRALPDPRDPVLKWAIIPHPNRPGFDVKAKDRQGRADLARYFIDFLGCETKPSEGEHVTGLLDALEAYVQTLPATVVPATALREVQAELEAEPIITTATVIEKLKRHDAFAEEFDAEALRRQLAKHEVADLAVRGSTLRRTKIEYRLPSGIIIRGPRAEMESLVQVVQQGTTYEIRIQATTQRPEPHYV